MPAERPTRNVGIRRGTEGLGQGLSPAETDLVLRLRDEASVAAALRGEDAVPVLDPFGFGSSRGRAAVIVPLMVDGMTGAVRVLLTKRAARLRNHAGETCFPGEKHCLAQSRLPFDMPLLTAGPGTSAGVCISCDDDKTHRSLLHLLIPC